jgi:competence protein CoiA
MRARSYTSNGCYHCDALYGQHYEIHARYVEEDAASFEGAARDKWQAVVEALEASEDGHLI